ncbi:MAG: T9SS type A sorting domain-containing protein [Sphingobacteriia bacterium]|nr:T9SS type A sorting domain-containing protein [Sphingobacteriia bacterium]
MKTNQILLKAVILIIVMLPAILPAQTEDKPYMHREIPDDPWLPNAHQNKKTGPAYMVRNSGFFSTQVNVNEFGENIFDDAANEPSITVDPNDPLRMVIGWRQFDNVVSNFRQAGYAYSVDGGETWTFPGAINPGVFRSDPVLDADSEGNIYYNSLSVDNQNNYWCDVFKAEGVGFEWDDGTFAQGGDKQWMVIDRTGGMGEGHIYSFWNSSFSICYPLSFTRSIDAGVSYEDCVEVSGDPYWGTMAVGPDGELYVAGAGQFGSLTVSKSTMAQNPAFPVYWDFVKQVYVDGSLNGWTNINPEGLMGQANICVDKSGGPGNGYVYVLASVERLSNNDPADVMFARSTDGGVTWDSPVRINDDPEENNYQWFGTMSVAPGGRIDVIWLDTRNALTGTYLSSLYYSFSFDNGETWSENEQLSEAFDPHVGWPNQEKLGDYFDMISDNQSAHLAWAGTFNGEQDVYYGRITPIITTVHQKPQTVSTPAISCFPNPFTRKATISYYLPQTDRVDVSIFDMYGKKIKTLVNTHQEGGTHTVSINGNQLTGGLFICKITIKGMSKTTTFVHLK